jgi:hypothetical protein
MRFSRPIKRSLACAISIIMFLSMAVIPFSRTVEAQEFPYDGKLIVSPNRSSVGRYIYLEAVNLPPNKTHYLHYRLYVGGGAFEREYEEAMVTDANGRLSKLIGPLTANDVGYWIMRMTQFPNGGVFGRLEWIVDQVPFKLTVSNTILEPGELFNWVITGATRPSNGRVGRMEYRPVRSTSIMALILMPAVITSKDPTPITRASRARGRSRCL